MALEQKLQEILTNSGLEATAAKTLESLHIRHVATVAALEKTAQPFVNIVLPKYMAALTDPKPAEAVAAAIWQVVWEECTQERSARVAQAMASLPTGHSPPAVGASNTGATPSTAASKPPTTLAPGVWQQRITLYENFYTPKRSFPERLLIGAEKTLARMVHEHEESKMYSLINLGEIMQTRHFNAMGDVNQQATKETQRTLTLEGGEITEKRSPTWQPTSTWQVLDGLEATKWAVIFAQWASEEETSTVIEYYVRIARQLNSSIWIFNEWWKHSFWKIAMRMRHGSTFSKAAHDIISDQAEYQDFLHRRRNQTPPPKRPRQSDEYESPAKRPRWGETPKGGKGKKGKGKGNEVQADKNQEKKKLNKEDICRNYNKGTCQNNQCKRAHICSACFARKKRFHHPEKECRSSEKKE